MEIKKMNMRRWWLLLMPLLGFGCAKQAYSDVEHSSCYEAMSDSEKTLAKMTKEKIVVSKNPEFPQSLRATSLAHKSLEEHEQSSGIGCVVLKFQITKDGKVDNIEVLKSFPENVFNKSAIHALKGFQFVEAQSEGIQVFNYQIED